MKKTGKILASMLCVATLACGTLGALVGCGGRTEISVSGSTSVEAIMTPLAAAYEEDNNVRVNISANGSGAGISDTIDGRNEIGMSSRALKSSETEKGIEGKTLCLDGIVLVVSKNCAVDEVTNKELYDLYMNATPISQNGATISVAVGRTDGSGTRDAFDEMIIQEDEGEFKGKSIKDTKLPYDSKWQKMDGTGLVISAIESDANNHTVGYISMGSYLKNTDKLKALKVKAYGQNEYVEANTANVLNNSYKLQRPFVIVTRSGKSGMSDAAKSFYDWLFGDAAKKIISDNGYVLTNG